MLRALGLLASCYVLRWSAAHPLCWVDDKPTDLEKTTSTFCPKTQEGEDGAAFVQVGSCCTDDEEAVVKAKFEETSGLSEECSALYKQVVCGTCHSFSAHLYEKLGAELGPWDGMTMKRDFCTKFTSACNEEIPFLDYTGGVSYCEKHVGSVNGDDNFWSYPYTEDEIFEAGLSQVFPDVDDLPSKAYSMKQSPGGSMYWVAGLDGEIRKILGSEASYSSTVLNVSGGTFYVKTEEGLLDFAFDPNFEDNDFFYVSFTVNLSTDTDDPKGQQNRLSKFAYYLDDPAATRASEEVLITSAEKDGNIHSAGWLGFKPSTYGKGYAWNDLYWTTGDGGLQTDPRDNSQNLQNYLGSVMRISMPSEAGSTANYTIPSGNYKDVDSAAPPELCAPGFRNPWRCSFDRETDELYCGDVGHTMVEEVDKVECGKNYGWSRFEGSRCQEAAQTEDFKCSEINRADFEFPVYEYCHFDYTTVGDDEFTNGVDICSDSNLKGLSIIGGFIYRGEMLADLLYGAYVFADFNNKGVYYLKKNSDDDWKYGGSIMTDRIRVASLAEDLDGELMLLNGSNIFHLPCGDLCSVPSTSAPFPADDYIGCFKDEADDLLFTFNFSSDDMSASACEAACPDSGFYGTQYGRECWCGEAGSDYSRHGAATNCNFACSGSGGEACGGLYRMSIYHAGNSVASLASTHLGCFKDKEGEERVFATKALTSALMSASLCKSACAGYSYYGMQYSTECWCGDEEAGFDQHGTSNSCDSLCPDGDGVETCGGLYAMDVYRFGDSAPSPTPPPTTTSTPLPSTYLGCYKDIDGPSRMFEFHSRSLTDMNNSVCNVACSQDGFSFYGTQFGRECWCGDDEADYGQHGTSTRCIWACPGGDGEEKCGGLLTMDVYRYGDSAPPTPTTVVVPVPSTYLGCYNDAEGPTRIFEFHSRSLTDMNNALCNVECSQDGFSFYGTQFGRECWCGHGDADYDQHGTSTRCNWTCPGGDGEETCGGLLTMDVHAF